MSTNLGDATSSVNSFQAAAASLQFNIPSFTPDGKIHRFDRDGKKNAWYVAFQKSFNGRTFIYARFGDWKTQEKHEWKTGGDLSAQDNAEMRRLIEEAIASQAEEKSRLREEAKNAARQFWELAEPRITPYMERKKISMTLGTRATKDGVLLIPTMIGDEMVGLQRIWPNGDKYFLKGQEVRASFFIIGARDNVTYLCEGFATGASIHAATGRGVIICFSAANLLEISRKVPHAIIAADNDRFTEGNPGLTAASKCGVKFIAPQFPDDDDSSTDFNDLHIRCGLDEVRKQLEVVVVMGNVVGIKSKAPVKAKKKMSEIYLCIAEAIDGRNKDNVPDFPIKFHVVEPSPGTRLIAQETDPQVLHYVSEKAVTQAILQYAHQLYLPRTGDGVGFEHKHASECMKFWRSYVDAVPEPKMVSWPGEDGYTLRRLPWNMELGPTPVFDEMMKRTSNSKALKKFIGSLFFAEADLQQYVWLFSDGQTGKGAISRFMRRALNGAYSAQMVPSPNDKFWTSGLIGARLVVFPDCNNKTFVASGLFKSLTGGDPVKIEQKGQQPFTTELKAKYMFLSNERPHLSSEKADMRRAIFCEMSALTEDTRPSYEDELWAEGGRFLASCFSEYQAACPQHGPIKLTEDDNRDLNDWISTVEEEFEANLRIYFKLTANHKCEPHRFQMQLDHIWKKDRHTQSQFRSWLERKHQIKKKLVKEGKEVARYYLGIECVPFPSVKTADTPNAG